jgi:hypothetical protein
MTDDVLAERVDRQARNSTVLEWCVRVGMVAYGGVHLLVAWVAVRLALVGGGGTATGGGAMAQLAGDAWGRTTLSAMTLAFATLVVWQAVVAVVGFRDRSPRRRLVERVGAASRAVSYAYFTFASGRLVLRGPAGSSGSPRAVTSGVLSTTAGPALVLAVGVVVAAIGIGLAVFGIRRGFLGQLEERARRGQRRGPIVWLATVGYLSKGAAFVVVGVLLGWAGITHDPTKSGGIDQAFAELLGRTLGTVAVLLAGAGIGCFGLYLFVVSRHLDDESLTS